MNKYVSLHNHSHYSFLDGLSTIPELVSRAKELNQKAVALTDHGNLCGSVEFYKICKSLGVKPILGMEAYFTPDKKRKGKSQEVNSHLILLAKNNIGWQNIMKIASKAYLENFYYKPRATLEMLDQHKEGVIITSACLASPFRKAWHTKPELDNSWDEASENLIEMFEGNIFFETQTYEAQDQTEYNEIVRREAIRRKIPVICTSDCHYTLREDHSAHNVMLAMQTRSYLSDPNRMKHDSHTLYLHSLSELIRKGFPEEEIANTSFLADLCDVELDFSIKFPKLDNSMNKIKRVCKERLEIYDRKPEYVERCERELEVIENCGFADYFIILSEIVSWAKSKRIRVGPARGSSAGSLVCQLLGITDIDPIKHKLLFERFLHSERIGLPDIDTDFDYNRRGEVIEYIIEKFGRDKTANICTIHRLGLRQSFKDVCHTHGTNFQDTNVISKKIDKEFDSFKEAMRDDPDLMRLYEASQFGEKIVEYTDKFKGMPRQPGTHAAAMVVAPDDITNYIPLMKSKDDIVTMFDMYSIEDMGLVKFDILGLKALSIIDQTIDKVLSYEYPEPKIRKLDDQDVFEMISQGHTLGCFQIETRGITGLCKRIGVKNFEDIVHVISLYRPAVLGTEMMETYLKNRDNPGKIRYVHPDLEEYLKDTYGICLFQEQLMQMSMKIAGFTPSQADTLRKGIGKKKAEVLMELKADFIAGARGKNYSVREAERMFGLIEAAGNYSFNRSHAVAYAIISYYTAWLKYHYPVQFMCCLLNNETKEEKLQSYFAECHRLGIEVLPLDINKSDYNHKSDYEGTRNFIRPGMKIIKGAGEIAIDTIMKERGIKPFSSFEDFLARFNSTKVSSKLLTALIGVGAFDSLNYDRAKLMSADYIDTVKKIKKSGELEKGKVEQSTLFDMSSVTRIEISYDDHAVKYTENQIRRMEMEYLGLYLDNPLKDFFNDGRFLASWEEIEEKGENVKVHIAGIVESPQIFSYRDKRTNQYKEGCRFTIRTMDDIISTVIFDQHLARVRSLLEEGSVVIVGGKYRRYNDENSFVSDIVRRLIKDRVEV